MWKCKDGKEFYQSPKLLYLGCFGDLLTARAKLDVCYCSGLNVGLCDMYISKPKLAGVSRDKFTVGVHFGELEDGLMDLGSDPGVN